MPYDEAATTLGSVEQLRVGGRDFDVRSARRATGGWLIELEGIVDRDAADILRGAEVEIARANVKVEPGEYLIADLVGCDVQDKDGKMLGQVKSILDNGAHDVLVINDDLMIPLVDEWVVAVDLVSRRITVETVDAL
jgi:16S rRNA processing protein RimM